MRSYSFNHFFTGMKSRDVSQSIIRWLEVEGAKIKAADVSHIRAVHGKGWVLVQDRNSKKIMDIFLLEKPEGVEAVAQVKPSLLYFDDAPRCEGEIERAWSSLIAELWATVAGGDAASRLLITAGELKQRAEERKRKSKRSIFWGMLINAVWIIIFALIIGLFGYQSHDGAVVIAAVLSPLMIIGIGMAFWGFAQYLADVTELKRVDRMERGGKV